MKKQNGNSSRDVVDGTTARLDVPPQASRSLSVLVADDIPAFQKVIAHLLQRRGHRVTIAGNGREAIDYFGKGKFDAVVLDLKMPYMGGLDVAREIRRRENGTSGHTTIIALTSHTLAADRQECLDAGMDAYLTKPVDATKLIQLVEQQDGRVEDSRTHDPELAEGTGEEFEAAIRRLGGDVDLFKEFVIVFDEDIPGLMQSLRESIQARMGPEVEGDAHKLRGLLANFGANKAVGTAEKLEENGKKGRWDETDSLLQRLEAEVAQLSHALNAYRDPVDRATDA